MDYDPRLKLNVFEDPTTYKTDYCKFIPHTRQYHIWPKDRSERPEKPCRKYEPIDLESYIKWKKGVHIPFNLFIKPRPIIDTNPAEKYPKLEEEVDVGKEEAVKTRPRLYVSPAISMDDVPDAEMRRLICNHMYTTEWNKAVKEAACGVNEFPIPDSTLEKTREPVTLNIDLYPPLPAGWRQQGKAWDDKQKRACVDPTAQFWLNRGSSVKCGACVNPFKGVVPKELKEEIADLVRHDKLRLAHDYPKPLYCGYKPRLSRGVPLSKQELPISHPGLSTSQALAFRVNKKYRK